MKGTVAPVPPSGALPAPVPAPPAPLAPPAPPTPAEATEVTLPSRRARDGNGEAEPTRKRRKRVPSIVVNDEVLREGIKFVKQHRPRVLESEGKLDMLMLHLELRHQHWRDSQRSNHKPRTMNFAKEVARLLHRDRALAASAWSDYVHSKEVNVVSRGGMRGAKHHKFDRTPQLRSAVRVWLEQRKRRQQPTTARDVVRFLVDSKHLPADVYVNERAVSSAVRTVQRYLAAEGFHGVFVGGKMLFQEKPSIVRKRDRYVDFICSVAQRSRIVYISESIVQHGGKKYGFIGAMISKAAEANTSLGDADSNISPSGSNTRAPVEADERGASPSDATSEAHVIATSIDSFEIGRRTKEHWGVFDHRFTVSWMRSLLATLGKSFGEGLILVLSDERHHRRVSDQTPGRHWTKQRLVQYCRENSIDVAAESTKTTLVDKAVAHAGITRPAIAQLAKEAGNEVVYCPAQHLELMPMSSLWSELLPEALAAADAEKISVQEAALRDIAKVASERVEKLIQAALHATVQFQRDEHIQDTRFQEDAAGDGDSTESDSDDYADEDELWE